jgi:hypothetical protein
MSAPTLSRPMRDLIVQVLATVMIPLTIAGTGLYYTRWQQNLNDLKTMIDLVSDQSADRRKYGVAMFEYLLKNDKVPVEFVAAQLDYANSSSDKDLLPLMEAALVKASVDNPSVATTFTQALERLPSRLFVHVLNDEQAQCVRKLFGAMKDFDRGSLAVPSIVAASWGGADHELRVLQESDRKRAEDLISVFNGLGLRVKLVDLSQSWAGAKKVRPNTMELWIGSGPLPNLCITQTG